MRVGRTFLDSLAPEGLAFRRPPRAADEHVVEVWRRRNLLALEGELARFELLEDLAQRVDQLFAIDPGLRERDVELERSVLRAVDEVKLLRLSFSGGRALLLIAKVVARGSRAHELDRGFHLPPVAELGDLEEHRPRVDVGAPTFLAQVFGDVEERHRLRDRHARLSDGRRDLLLCVSVLIGERRVPRGLLERMQVAAVEVLDQRDLHDLVVRDVELDARYLGEPGFHRRTEAPLPCDDPETPGWHRADQDRLEDALGLDRHPELLEIADAPSRLVRI